jgi:hypothetical protein
MYGLPLTCFKTLRSELARECDRGRLLLAGITIELYGMLYAAPVVRAFAIEPSKSVNCRPVRVSIASMLVSSSPGHCSREMGDS